MLINFPANISRFHIIRLIPFVFGAFIFSYIFSSRFQTQILLQISIFLGFMFAYYVLIINKSYWLLILYVIMGGQHFLYSKLAYPINLTAGITLYLDDIVIFFVFLSFLVAKKQRQLNRDLYFYPVIKLFLVIVLINLFIKVVLFHDLMDFNGMKNWIRNLVPFSIYFLLYFFLKKSQIKCFLRMNLLFLIVVVVLMVFIIFGFIHMVDDPHLILKITGTTVKRRQIPYGYFLWVPFFLIMSSFFSKRKLYNRKLEFLLLISTIVISLLTYYRSYSSVFLLGLVIVIFSRARNQSRKLNIVLVIIGSIIVLNSLSEPVFGYNVLDSITNRLFSGFTELKYNEGTGGSRISQSEFVIDQLKNIFHLLFGVIFLKESRMFANVTSSDIGILLTVVQGGIFILIPVVMFYKRINKLYFMSYDNEILDLFRMTIVLLALSTFPIMLFSHEMWFNPLQSTGMLTLMGLFDVKYAENYKEQNQGNPELKPETLVSAYLRNYDIY